MIHPSPTALDRAIEEMAREIVAIADPERIVLFGSRADGAAADDSDIDLLVVDRGAFGPNRDRRAETARLYLALRRFPWPKDILLYGLDEWEQRRGSDDNVVGAAERRGRVLYERA